MSFSFYTEMMVDPNFLRALCTINVDELAQYSDDIITIVLPYITRCALCWYKDCNHLSSWDLKRKSLIKLLLKFPEVNALVESLSTDFSEVASDCHDQLVLRKKQYQVDGYITYLDSVSIEFDSYSPSLQYKVIISEFKWLSTLMQQNSSQMLKLAPILESELHRDTIVNLLALALHELPDVLKVFEAVEVILLLPDAFNMFKKLLLNLPWAVDQVCESLILKSNDKEPEQTQSNRVECIKFICRLSPTATTLATNLCNRMNKLSHLLIWIHLKLDEKMTVSKIAEFLFTHKCVSKPLLQQKTANGSMDTDLLTTMRSTLDNELKELVAANPAERNCTRTSTVIKVYAFLRDLVSYKYSEGELEKLLTLCTSLRLVTESDMTVALEALCLVIASIHQMAPHSHTISSWFKVLAHNTRLFTHCYETSVGQFLLLLAIHYHSNQLSTIAEMVASHLSIKPSVVKVSNSILKQIITFEVFTEQVISQLTALLSITENLNSKMTGHLPIHCVCQLLKSRTFSKHNINISDWIYRQLCSLSLPVHPMVIQMIRLYVSSTIPQQHNLRSANERLDEDKLHRQLMETTTEENLASQLSLLYYVLHHQEAIYSDSALMVKRKSIQLYSSSLINSIPISLLITWAYQRRSQTVTLYAPIIKLMYNQVPHLCKTSMWLPESKVHTRCNSLIKHFANSFSDVGQTISIHRQYLRQQQLTSKLCDMATPTPQLSVLMSSVRLIQSSPPDIVPRHMTSMLLRLWMSYSRTVPEKLYTATVNTVMGGNGTGNQVSEDQLIADPLLILRSLQSCREPDIVSMLLHIIDVYSRASNRYYSTTAQLGSGQSAESHEICYSLLAAQESAIIQILLEQCVHTGSAYDQTEGMMLSNLGERQALICSYVHKAIIEQPNLAKLVSFQGYDRRVIPVAVRGIPSLHICLDYVPELLAQPDINKQVFAIRLTSSMCEHYNIHKTFGMAKLCINTVITLIGVLPSHVIVSHILPVMSDLVNMCQRMPVLYEDWIYLLAKIVPILAALKGVVSSAKLKAKVIALNTV